MRNGGGEDAERTGAHFSEVVEDAQSLEATTPSHPAT